MRNQWLFGYLFQPLQHSEHHTHGEQAEGCENSPAHPLLREVVQHRYTEGDEQVSDGGCGQPQALADTLQVFRRNFGNEGEPKRGDEQFGYRQEEVGEQEHCRTGFDGHFGCIGPSGEFEIGGILFGNGDDGQENVGASGDKHTEGDFLGCGNRFALASEGSEDEHDNRCEHDYKERVDALPDFGGDAARVDEIAGEDGQRLAVLVE